jgi:nuclear transport factor 2 (NTF2) superfamily protein
MVTHWTFDKDGLMKTRNASINDMEIQESDRFIGLDLEKEKLASDGVFK